MVIISNTLFTYSLTFNGPYIHTYSFFIEVYESGEVDCTGVTILSSITTYDYEFITDDDDPVRWFVFAPFQCSMS